MIKEAGTEWGLNGGGGILLAVREFTTTPDEAVFEAGVLHLVKDGRALARLRPPLPIREALAKARGILLVQFGESGNPVETDLRLRNRE